VEWGKKRGPGNILQCSGALSIIIVTRSGAANGERRKVQYTIQGTIFRCVIHHQCNTERSRAEIEERSREHNTMFRCLTHNHCNTEQSGAEWSGAGERGKKKGPGNIIQCLGALPIIIVTWSGTERNGAERGKKKGPGNIIQYSGALSIIIVTQSGAERGNGERREVQRTFYNVQVPYPSSL